MVHYNIQFPENPNDGDQILDAIGNAYQYQAREGSWEYIGIIQKAQEVNPNTNGIVPPETFNKIKKLQNLILSGVSFDKNKIYIGKTSDTPYFYYFYSSNDLIVFTPETINDTQKLGIEVSKGQQWH